MKPKDLENIIENNGVYILTKQQMQDILAQMNKPPTPAEELGKILVAHVDNIAYNTSYYPWARGHTASFHLAEVDLTQRIEELVSMLMCGALG